jgi:hypothetical protein
MQDDLGTRRAARPPARRLFGLVLALALAVPLPAWAEGPGSDGIIVEGLLADADLYRLATCGAHPGGDCRSAPLAWDKSALTVTVLAGEDPLPPGFEARLTRATVDAIAEINATGADIRLSYTSAPFADIVIRTTALPEGTVLTETPGFSGPGVMGVGYVTVWSDEANRILEAVILISTEIGRDEMPSVVLEELTQSLGFLYDIEGPAYEGVSILSQSANTTVTLRGQDAALLRLHYP